MNTRARSYLHMPTIPREFIAQMVEHLPPQELANSSLNGLVSDLLSKKKVSINEYRSLHRCLAEHLDDEMLGFLPRPVPRGSLNTLSHLLVHSPDLYSALENYNRFYSLFLDAEQTLLDLSQLRSQHCIELRPISGRTTSPMFQQTIMMALVKIPSWLAGQQLPIHSLHFQFDAMPFDREFAYLYGAVPSFGAASTRLQFQAAALAFAVRPSLNADDYSKRFMEHFLYWSDEDDLTRRVYAEISHRLGNDDADVIAIAGILGVSKHTLARHLKARGTSYSTILAKVRRDKALYQLVNSDASIEAIAEQLGYTETGSFSRSFKSWMGISPADYRKTAQQNATKC
ncbi:helix-turn-helix domain-containing protein [Spongiibacter marinus]|uniref:helix-turn-helix domain-containing protein n=1 Tax=Spongiibacter marinus TaxID=354246 RepID=UPI0035BE5381